MALLRWPVWFPLWTKLEMSTVGIKRKGATKRWSKEVPFRVVVVLIVRRDSSVSVWITSSHGKDQLDGARLLQSERGLVCALVMCMWVCFLAAHQNRVSDMVFSLESEWVVSTGHDKSVSWMCTQSGSMLGRHYFTAWASCLQYPSLTDATLCRQQEHDECVRALTPRSDMITRRSTPLLAISPDRSLCWNSRSRRTPPSRHWRATKVKHTCCIHTDHVSHDSPRTALWSRPLMLMCRCDRSKWCMTQIPAHDFIILENKGPVEYWICLDDKCFVPVNKTQYLPVSVFLWHVSATSQ